MSPGARKILVVIGGLLVAAGVTYFPWLYWDHAEGSLGTLYGFTMTFWAPTALIAGLIAGVVFARKLWPANDDTDG